MSYIGASNDIMKLLCTLLIGVLPMAGIATAQDSAEIDQDGHSRSGTFPVPSQATSANSQTVHTNKSGVITTISVVNTTNIDHFSGSKKLSEWFDQLCTGALARGRDATIRANVLMAQARAAISDMGGEAVPYLLSQLRIDSTGQVENQLRQLRNSAWENTATLDYLDSIILPSTRRSHAAQLLGDIGAPAGEALPVLVELWSQHSEGNRTPYYLGIQKILHDLNPSPELVPKEFSHWSERLAFETNVIAAAIEYCPQLPNDLKSQFGPLLKAAGQGESPSFDSADAPSR